MTLARSAQVPGPLRAARALMFVVAGMSALWCAAFLAGYGWTAENLGTALVQLVPGLASFWLALRIKRGGNRVRIGVIVLQAAWVLIALGRIGQGDPSGVLGLVFPVAVLVLVTRASARDHFRQDAY